MNKAAVKSAGFAPATRSPKRLIMMVNGLWKVGKTRLAFTAPKPLGYICIEQGGDEGVIDQFIPKDAKETEQIQVARIRIGEPDVQGDSDEAYQSAVQEQANIALDEFWAAYQASLDNFKTTVVDTGTDLWELVRLAYFGKLERIPTLQYTNVNREFDRIIAAGQESKGNVIWIHRMKDQGVVSVGENGKENWRPGGAYVPVGYKDIPYKCHSVVELWKDELEEFDESTGRMVKFHGTITASRHNADAMGMQLDDDFTFADIAQLIIPGSTSQDWQ